MEFVAVSHPSPADAAAIDAVSSRVYEPRAAACVLTCPPLLTGATLWHSGQLAALIEGHLDVVHCSSNPSDETFQRLLSAVQHSASCRVGRGPICRRPVHPCAR
jgi:hypothetical protein